MERRGSQRVPREVVSVRKRGKGRFRFGIVWSWVCGWVVSNYSLIELCGDGKVEW